ncbi:fimbrial protein [Klebsiella grimontii]|uniref:fimbrial protein n=1 Tax=Klebsiella grimontii TaxID=2058152 RepID=UPI0025A0A812|nr:fimbrial protein [Klebsiella grimontii]MDM7239306.1 fimbrial protein [Klebsiella grimontii]
MATRVIGRKSCITLLLCGGVFTLDASAAVEGEITPVGGPKMYNIDVANQDITNNSIGATIPYVFSLGGQYSGIASCTIPMENEAIYYSATASLLQQGSTPGYFKLNDYMDVKIEIYIRGQRMEYLPVPFNNESNQAYQNKCVPPTTQFNNFESGAQGRVTFMITKPIVNGVNLLGTEIAKLYGRLGNYSAGMGSTPMSIVSINSGVITVPDKCIVNSGSPIVVDFNTIPSAGSLLNGNNYSQSVPIQVKCEGGSFATGNLNIRLGIQQANTASFNSDYLGTTGAVDRSNLGIILKDSGGNLVAANKFYDVPGFNNNQGTWNLTAAPIANAGTNVLEGDFQASATVVAEFQ